MQTARHGAKREASEGFYFCTIKKSRSWIIISSVRNEEH
jgi:hypothetical protein